MNIDITVFLNGHHGDCRYVAKCKYITCYTCHSCYTCYNCYTYYTCHSARYTCPFTNWENIGVFQ